MVLGLASGLGGRGGALEGGLGTSHGGVAGGSIEDTKNGVTPEGHAVEKLWRAISS